MKQNELNIDLSKQNFNFSEIQNLHEYTEIRFNNYFEKITIPLSLNDFSSITKLSFYENSKKDLFEIPDNLEKLIHLKHLTLWSHCDFTKGKPMPNVEELHTVVINTEKDTRNIVGLFPNLKKIEIWGSHSENQKLPDEIENLSQLQSLSLISCGLNNLPNTLVNLKQLTELNLRGLKMNRFPEIITELKNLEILEIRQPLKKLPDSFINLKKLIKLNLNGSLNDGNMDVAGSFLNEKVYLKPIPEVIGKLENLEDLNLGICGVFDISPIFSLNKLKKLTLTYSALKNCEGFLHFPLLEKLILNTSYDLKNLDGLKGLPLKKLDISSNYFKSIEVISSLTLLETLNINGCSYIRDYLPLYNHPKIKKLKADSEILKKWKHREKYNRLPKIDLIISQLKTDNLIEFEELIQNLSKHIEANYNDDNNPLAGYFNIEIIDEQITEIEILDSAIQKHIKNLSNKTLITIFEMTFKSVGYDNFNAALIVLQEIIVRKDAATQEKIIKKFYKACEYYDAGHRFWSYTVYDQLIDVLFGQFTSEALYKLLKKASDDMLNNESGDAMDGLFVPAFQNTKDEKLQKKILNVFFKYEEESRAYYSKNYFDTLLQQIKSVISENLQQFILIKKEQNKEEEKLIVLLQESKEENLPIIIEMLGTKITEELLNNYLYKITDACKKTNLLETSVTKLLDFLIEADKIGYLPGILISQYHKNAPDKIFDFLKKHIDKKRFNSTELLYLIKTVIENLTDVNIPLEDLKKYEDFAVNNCGFSYDEIYNLEINSLLDKFFQHDSYRSDTDINWTLENIKTILEKVTTHVEYKELQYNTYLLVSSEEYQKTKQIFDVLHPKTKNINNEHVLFYNIIASVKLNDKLYFDILYKEVQKLKEIKQVLLAYNLACAFGYFEQKEEMMVYIRKSLQLGKSKQQFLDDSDFEKYWNDTDFLTVIEEDLVE